MDFNDIVTESNIPLRIVRHNLLSLLITVYNDKSIYFLSIDIYQETHPYNLVDYISMHILYKIKIFVYHLIKVVYVILKLMDNYKILTIHWENRVQVVIALQPQSALTVVIIMVNALLPGQKVLANVILVIPGKIVK